MIALLMCIIMKILECSSRRKGRGSPVRCECKAGRRRRSGPRPCRPRGGGQPLSPRKQPPLEGHPPQAGAPPSSPLLGGDSAALPLGNNNDADFTHDNSDYQWFLDYNYRDSSCQHASVLSSLSSSYRGLGGCYEELARDLDANLAEADMESFRTRDIHALLSQLPAGHLMHDTNRQGEMFASVSSSLMEKFCFDSSFSPHTSSQGEESSAGSINTMSLCKSELLFSPIREGVEATHFSVDSLDCDGLDSDIILTCRANKHNYTIAFEGSTTMYSEDSDCQDPPHDKTDMDGMRYSSRQGMDEANNPLHRSFRLSRPTEASMANSDTTWSKLRSRSQLKRHPSGNNNTQTTSMESSGPLRSLSAPDLRDEAQLDDTHEATRAAANRLNPIDYIKAYNNHCSNHSLGSQASEGMSSSGDSRGPNNNQKPHNFNLVKLFMKQKSMSNDRIVGLDNSSECWPNSSEGGDSGDSFSTDSKNNRGNRFVTKMNLSSDKDYQSDDCEVPTKDTTKNTKKWVDSEAEPYSVTTFEDSLVDGTTNTEPNCKRTHDFIIEEDEVSDKSDPDHEKNIYATVNKAPQMRFNVNNNNSFGSNTGSPIRIRGNATTQTKKSISSSINSGSLSSCSDSEGTQVTRMQRLLTKDLLDNKSTSTQFSVADVSDKSMQTSYLSTQSSRDRVKVIEKSFLDHLKAGDSQKPIYVLYPDYTLPNLDFISKEQEERVFLKPVKFNPNYEANKRYPKAGMGKRPFSCNDVEGLRRKGFTHIRDWDSLTFLLPLEYRQILAEMPEVVQQMKEREDEILRQEKPLFCVSPPVKHKTRPASCDCTSLMGNHGTNVSSSSSTATQPSSGYRGSSTMLTDSSAQNSPAPAPGFNPLFVYKYDSATSSETSFMNEKHRAGLMGAPPLPKRSISLAEQTKVAINGKVIDMAPPRPPLPKSILRKSIDKVRKTPPATTKRYSMFEMEDHLQDNVTCMNVQTDQKMMKRRSLQEPYYLLKNNSIVEMKKNNDLAAKRFSQQFLDATEKDIDDTEFFHDEGVGTESSLESGKSHTRPPTPPLPKSNSKIPDPNPYIFPTSLTYPVVTSAELQQLEEFLKHSGITCNDMDEWDNNHMQKVKNQVSKFLTMKKSDDDSLNSSCSSGHSKKSVSFAEKGEKKCGEGGLKVLDDIKLSTPPNSPNVSAAQRHYQAKNLAEIPICEEGESSPEGYASPAMHRPTAGEIAHKKDLISSVQEAVDLLVQEGTGSARTVVGVLCPALYTLMSDGLRENIDTSFGPATNSVWQVVEASARHGPITKSLNELVMRINSEDALSESVLKFNAFVMGLLNVRSLDAFVSYLMTRESILRRHYTASSILRVASGPSLQSPLTPLTNIPFTLDILWQLRDMHRSFKRMEDLMYNQSSANTMSSVGHLSKTQINLLKLIHSLHLSATNASSDDQRGTSQGSVIMRNKTQKSDPNMPDILDNSATVKTTTWVERARPRSCVNPTLNLLGAECPNNSGANSTYDPTTRRWSGVQLGSKLMQAFDRLALCDNSDDYTDSLENEDKSKHHSDKDSSEYKTEESNSSSSEWVDHNGGKFRRLQRRWEMLSGQEGSPHRTPCDSQQQSAGSPASTPGSQGSTPGSTSGKSRIPRPVTSPVRPATTPPNTVSPVKRGIPVAVGIKKTTSPSSSQKAPLPPSGKSVQGATPTHKKTPTRVSRVESCYSGPPAPRPSSLPYRRAPPPSPSPAATRPTRRAVSSDQPRHQATAKHTTTQSNKMVRTLWHRLPSDSGHLAFNEGERLRLVLEVDSQWLLCCRGQQKGLVPRSAVIPVPDTALQRF